MTATAERFVFGMLPDGREVAAVTLHAGGISATVLAWGATLQSLLVPDRLGEPADVTLGFDDLDGYLAHTGYFGATVGRFANRIAGGRFVLDGATYQLPLNDGPNSLHGGAAGFDRQLWDITAVRPGAVTLRLISPDGDQGYPGQLTVDATYALAPTGTLTIEYRATTDAPTIVNITNHAYWNLAGGGSALGHLLTIPADRFTPIDAALIPTGEMRDVAGTPFDFRATTALGARIRDGSDAQLGFGRGYDHNWAVMPAEGLGIRAQVADLLSGRSFELCSNHTGLQVYSGNSLDGSIVGKEGLRYRQGDAIVLEPQRCPDTPNRSQFGSARLGPGDTYHHTVIYRFAS